MPTSSNRRQVTTPLSANVAVLPRWRVSSNAMEVGGEEENDDDDDNNDEDEDEEGEDEGEDGSILDEDVDADANANDHGEGRMDQLLDGTQVRRRNAPLFSSPPLQRIRSTFSSHQTQIPEPQPHPHPHPHPINPNHHHHHHIQGSLIYSEEDFPNEGQDFLFSQPGGSGSGGGGGDGSGIGIGLMSGRGVTELDNSTATGGTDNTNTNNTSTSSYISVRSSTAATKGVGLGTNALMGGLSLDEDQFDNSDELNAIDTDSLFDASPEEVEARALEFIYGNDGASPAVIGGGGGGGGIVGAGVGSGAGGLIISASRTDNSNLETNPAMEDGQNHNGSMDMLNAHPQQRNELHHGIGNNRSIPALTIFDLPRQIPIEPEQVEEARLSAELDLKKCVDEIDDTNWMYRTPSVFGPPAVLDPRLRNNAGANGNGSFGDRQGGGDGDFQTGEGGEWLDRAFNIESYPRIPYDMDTVSGHRYHPPPLRSDDETSEIEADGDGDEDYSGETNPGMLERGFADIDSTAHVSSTSFGIPYLRDGEETELGFTGTSLYSRVKQGKRNTAASSGTSGLVRGVSQMAVHGS